MRLATIRNGSETRCVRLEDGAAIETGHSTVGDLLVMDDWESVAASASGTRTPEADVEYAPVVPQPGKVICVGLNYRNHILEMGRDLPDAPTLFAKYPEALIGPADEIHIDAISESWDWEAELAIVIGAPARRCSLESAERAIAGFSIINDVTARDFQNRTKQWLQGKTFEHTSPFGPVLVTPDELRGGCAPELEITCAVDGEIVQRSNTSELVFDPPTLVEYISQIITLNPGDVIATGTPGGVGHARDPARYIRHDNEIVTAIESIGELRNTASAR